MSQQKSDYVGDTDVDTDLNQLPDDEAVEATAENLGVSRFGAIIVNMTDEMLEAMQSHIPAGVSAMNSRSTTLEEIGLDDYPSEGDHEWESPPDQIWGINDDAERQTAHRDSQTTDYFLGGINVIARAGEPVAADLSGSHIGVYPLAASSVVIVSGTNKIAPTLGDASGHLEPVAYPFENGRVKEAYDAEFMIAKQLIFRQEVKEGRIIVALIREQLGY